MPRCFFATRTWKAARPLKSYEKMQVLAALRVHPWRKKLSSLANELQREAFGEGQHWFLQMWIEGIAFHVERRCAAAEREAIARDDAIVREAIARDVIATMPADLRTRCPRYPSLHDPDQISAAAVTVGLKIKTELSLGIHGGDLDAIAIGRLALEAMGYKGARHLRLWRTQEDSNLQPPAP